MMVPKQITTHSEYPYKIIPYTAIVMGVAGMVITMGLPDDLDFYMPVFYLNTLWLIAMGIVTLRSGIRMEA